MVIFSFYFDRIRRRQERDISISNDVAVDLHNFSHSCFFSLLFLVFSFPADSNILSSTYVTILNYRALVSRSLCVTIIGILRGRCREKMSNRRGYCSRGRNGKFALEAQRNRDISPSLLHLLTLYVDLSFLNRKIQGGGRESMNFHADSTFHEKVPRLLCTLHGRKRSQVRASLPTSALISRFNVRLSMRSAA